MKKIATRAEKVSALRTEEYFAERAARGDLKKAVQVLKRAGKGNHPFLVTNCLRRCLGGGVEYVVRTHW